MCALIKQQQQKRFAKIFSSDFCGHPGGNRFRWSAHISLASWIPRNSCEVSREGKAQMLELLKTETMSLH